MLNPSRDIEPYFLWNDALLVHFFNEGQAEQLVHLYVTRAVLEKVASENNISANFISSVRSGPDVAADQHGVCEKAIRLYRHWRRWSKTPPFFAYLALFALAANSDKRWRTTAYYPHLRHLLGEVGTGMYHGFGETPKLWHDLETWCNDDMAGSLGLFRATRAGHWPYVSYPFAQVILSQDERRSLRANFPQLSASVESGATDRELASSVLDLRPELRMPNIVSLRLLRDGRPNDIATLLAAEIRRDFVDWRRAQNARFDDMPKVRGQLRLCLLITLGTAKVTLRPYVPDYESEESITVIDAAGEPLTADYRSDGWFSELYSATCPFDGSKVDWSSALELHSEGDNVCLRHTASYVRFFVSGATDGIAGYIETSVLPATERSHIFLNEDDPRCKGLREWLQRNAVEPRIENLSGIPAKWTQLTAEGINVTKDDPPPTGIDTAIARPRIKLLGGIRSGNENEYFRYALPDVSVKHGTPVDVHVNNQPVERILNGVVRLDGSSDSRIRSLNIEIRITTGELLSKVVRIAPNDEGEEHISPHWLNVYGTVSGVGFLIAGAQTTSEPSSAQLLRLRNCGRILLLGSKIGEVTIMDGDTPNADSFVWAFVEDARLLHRIGPATPPVPRARYGNHQQCMLWRSVFLRNRHLEVANLADAPLFNQYVSVANAI